MLVIAASVTAAGWFPGSDVLKVSVLDHICKLRGSLRWTPSAKHLLGTISLIPLSRATQAMSYFYTKVIGG